MLNKKFKKLAVLSVLGLLTLASCSDDDEIVAKPSNYEDPIVVIDGNKDIENNVLSVIYDALHDGSIDSAVLEKVLYEYAQSIYGSYNKVTGKEGVTTLKEAAEIAAEENDNANIDVKKVNDFVKAHKVYWLRDENGDHVDESGKKVDDNTFTPCKTERQNVLARYNTINTRVAEKMYAKANSSSYKEREYFFNEKKLVKSLYEAGEKVDYAKALLDVNPKVIIDYSYKEEDVFEEQDDGITVLHYEYYGTTANSDKFTYIEDKIIPEVYSSLLVEQYLMDEELASVRNSRAREINVIKLEKYSSFKNNADALVKQLVKDIYAIAPTGDRVLIQQDKIDDLFETYETVSKGIYEDIQSNPKAVEVVEKLQAIASDIYKDSKKVIDGSDKHYYQNTTYGDLVEDFAEFKDAGDDYDKLDKSLYDRFTSNGTILASEGFAREVISIEQTHSITDDWFVQSQAPSLDSNGTIADRLFKLSVANDKVEIGQDEEGKKLNDVAQDVFDKALVDQKNYDRYQKDENTDDWVFGRNENENKYLCSINGAYFLKFDGQSSSIDEQDEYKDLRDIVYDDGSAYYIVQVKEAVKDVKLRAISDSSYRVTRGSDFYHKTLDKITSIIAATGNYSSLSKEHWLKKMDITYHDQKVYDYFKANYPDLFDDDDEESESSDSDTAE